MGVCIEDKLKFQDLKRNSLSAVHYTSVLKIIYLKIRTLFDKHFSALLKVWEGEIADIERFCFQ